MEFFMDDRAAIAAYCLSNCAAAARETIAVADDVSARKFLFNLRWDMERTYEAVSFPGEIDWP